MDHHIIHYYSTLSIKTIKVTIIFIILYIGRESKRLKYNFLCVINETIFVQINSKYKLRSRDQNMGMHQQMHSSEFIVVIHLK